MNVKNWYLKIGAHQCFRTVIYCGRFFVAVIPKEKLWDKLNKT